MNVGECPANSMHTETPDYLGILVNVFRVVEVNEVVSKRLTKNKPRHHRKENADRDTRSKFAAREQA